MKCRVSYLLRFYLLTVLLFMAAKWVFMFAYNGEYAFSMGDVLDVTLHGLSLDLSTALYFFILPFLLTIISLWVSIPKWVYYAYYVLIAVAFALAFVADTSLYAFWEFKLDASCLQYLESPTEAMASVTTGYLALRVLLFLLVTLLITFLYIKVSPPHRPPLTSHPSLLTSYLLPLTFYLLLVPLIVIGIRGGLGESTTNIGQVYYSQNQFLNHSAVNPVFSFLSSLGIFSIVSEDPDSLLNTTRPNVVIILMESCGGQFTEIGGHPEITPRLNQLSREGIYFTECYANAWRTDRGTVSSLSGYPAFPLTSVMKIPEKSRKLPSIAASLAAEGYTTSFFHGGDINFTNMRSYLLSTGYQQLTWKADYSLHDQATAQWGVRDDLMFASLLQDITGERSPHWMKTLLTLSSHEPWDVPDKVLDDEVYNSFHYLDRCIGQFIDSLRQMPVWQNLLVVMLPDHGLRYKGIGETTRLYNHIPMIWVGGAVRSPRRVELVCNQSDLAATLLGQLHIDHSRYPFSRDVLSRNYRRHLAYHSFNNGVALFDSTGFVAYDFDANHIIAQEGPNTRQQLQTAKAILQLTSKDLKKRP